MVSIVVPNYNHGAYLKQRLESILNQTYQDFEIIILDDCSSDNSRQIIESYRYHPKVTHIIYNENNGGSPFLQWLKGVQYASGDFTWIAESDDLADPKFLEIAVDLLNKHWADAYWCNSNIINDNDELIGFVTMPESSFDLSQTQIFEPNELIEKYLIFSNIIRNASSAVFKTSLFSKLQLDVEYRLCGDFVIYINVLQDAKVVYNAERLNYYRLHKTNTSLLTSIKAAQKESKKVRADLDRFLPDKLRKLNKKAMYYDSGYYAMSLLQNGEYLNPLVTILVIFPFIFPDITFFKGFLYWTIKNNRKQMQGAC